LAENSAQSALNALIIADIEMPVHDGFFFARELRKEEQNGKTGGRAPLIALTAYGRVEDKVKMLASGFDTHIVKPVDLADCPLR